MDFSEMLAHARREARAERTVPRTDWKALLSSGRHAEKNGEIGENVGHELGILPRAMYWAEFVSEEAAKAMGNEVEKREFVQLKGRKLQNYGGVPHLSGTILEPMPEFAQALAQELHERKVFEEMAPNQALVNKYRPGEGIAPHADGPNFQPKAAILTLNSPAVIEFNRNGDDGALVGRVLLEPRSLFVFSEALFLECKHSIGFALQDSTTEPIPCCNAPFVKDQDILTSPTFPRGERISMTMRCVAKIQCKIDPLKEYVDPELKAEMERRKAWWAQAISQ